MALIKWIESELQRQIEEAKKRRIKQFEEDSKQDFVFDDHYKKKI